MWLVCFRTVSYVWLVCFVLRARFSEYTTGGVLTKCVALYEQFQNTIEKIVRKRYHSLFWLGAGLPINSDEVKLVLLAKPPLVS